MFSLSTPLGGPPRAVADAPAVGADAIAKGWLLELVAAASLRESANLPVAELAAEGPGLCVALLEAIRSDDGLQAIRGDTAAMRAGALAGATGPAAVVTAVEALRAAAWRELVASLPASADPGLVAALSHRLAHVCAVVTATALGAGTSAAAAPGALLILEVDDLQRLHAAEPGAGLDEDLLDVERALDEVLGAGDRLQRDGNGRWTVSVAGADAAAGRALAERLSRAFAATAPLRHGTRLTISIGLAVNPDDATDAPGLAAEAEISLFAARAAGVPVV